MALSTENKVKLLKNTGFFEGNDGYSNLAGNFDKQGISFGIIQFNFGQGTLEPLLKQYIKENNTEFVNIFGSTKAAELTKVVNEYTEAQQIAWSTGISTGDDNQFVVDSWAKPFRKMGESSKNRDLQKVHAKQYFDRAEGWAHDFDIKSMQGLAFLFDQAVHEWSFTSFSKAKDEVLEKARAYKNANGEIMPDRDRLSILLDYVRSNDGKERRTCIMNGSGTHNGKQYDVDDFGISYSIRH